MSVFDSRWRRLSQYEADRSRLGPRVIMIGDAMIYIPDDAVTVNEMLRLKFLYNK